MVDVTWNFELAGTFQPLIAAARQLLRAGAAYRHVVDSNDVLCLFIGSVEKDDRDFEFVRELDLFSAGVQK